MELKEILKLIKRKKEFLENIENITKEKFEEKRLEFEKISEGEYKELLKVINYNCEDMILSFELDKLSKDIPFENDFESLIKYNESLGNGYYDFEKYSIDEYETIFNNLKDIEKSISCGFKGYDRYSIEKIIREILEKKLNTNKNNDRKVRVNRH